MIAWSLSFWGTGALFCGPPSMLCSRQRWASRAQPRTSLRAASMRIRSLRPPASFAQPIRYAWSALTPLPLLSPAAPPPLSVPPCPCPQVSADPPPPSVCPPIAVSPAVQHDAQGVLLSATMPPWAEPSLIRPLRRSRSWGGGGGGGGGRRPATSLRRLAWATPRIQTPTSCVRGSRRLQLHHLAAAAAMDNRASASSRRSLHAAAL